MDNFLVYGGFWEDRVPGLKWFNSADYRATRQFK